MSYERWYISVVDSSGEFTTVEVRIFVQDVNEPPTLVGPPSTSDAARVIAKNAEPGTAVSGPALVVTDPDVPDSTFWYEVVCEPEADDCEAFGFAPETDPTVRILRPDLLDSTLGEYQVTLTVSARDRADRGEGLVSNEGQVRVTIRCPEVSCPAGFVAYGSCGPATPQSCYKLDQAGTTAPPEGENNFLVSERSAASSTAPAASAVLVTHSTFSGSEASELSRDAGCGTVVEITWAAEGSGARDTTEPSHPDAVRFFRVIGSSTSLSTDSPALAVVGIDGSDGG